MNNVLEKFYDAKYDIVTNGYIETILKSRNIWKVLRSDLILIYLSGWMNESKFLGFLVVVRAGAGFRSTAAFVFFFSSCEWGCWLYFFELWQVHKFGELGLVFENLVQVAFQVFLVEGFPQLAEDILVVENSSQRRIANSWNTQFLLHFEVVSSLRPQELERLASELKANFFDCIKIVLSLGGGAVKLVRQESNNAEIWVKGGQYFCPCSNRRKLIGRSVQHVRSGRNLRFVHEPIQPFQLRSWVRCSRWPMSHL